MAPTSLIENEAARERLEEGNFFLQSSVEVFGLHKSEMALLPSLSQSASFGNCDPGLEFMTGLPLCGLERVINL